MQLTDLDDYSMTAIIWQLDIASYKNIVLVCKKLNAIAKKSVNILLWQKQIQRDFVCSIGAGSDRDNIPFTMVFKYTMEMVLKSLLQTLKYIELVKLGRNRVTCVQSTTETRSIMPVEVFELLHKAMLCDSTGLESLCEIGYRAGMKINHWYTFCIENDTAVYICNAEHPERHLDSIKENAIIGIVDNKKHSTRAYCCNVTKIDWSAWHEISYATFSKSKDVLIPVCEELQKLFRDSVSVTPALLSVLAGINLTDYISDMRNTNLTDESKKVASLKRKFVLDFQSLPNKSKTLMHPFLNGLKMLCNTAVPFRGKIRCIESLVHSIAPFFKIHAVFGYGELLAYLPLTEKLLQAVDLYSRVMEDGEECISMLFSKIKLKLTLHYEAPVYIGVYHHSLLNIVWGEYDNDVYEVSIEEEKLVSLFADFIAQYFSFEEIVDIPVLNLRFVYRFIQLLFKSDVPESLKML